MNEVDRDVSEFGAAGTDEFRTAYDWESTAPSTGVVEAVSEATNREQLDLPQLYGALDPDALDSLVRSSDGPMSLAFSFARCEVTVLNDGEVAVKHSSTDPQSE
ncbi:HalOD1 output domain-containing protein [Halorubrum ejinorense]|uniref:HalOD1 output domain-containing protein n=1 Tax=Halorubrum ejinorense TaxID=425309 RepID=A0AAV3SPP3_9EURY